MSVKGAAGRVAATVLTAALVVLAAAVGPAGASARELSAPSSLAAIAVRSPATSTPASSRAALQAASLPTIATGSGAAAGSGSGAGFGFGFGLGPLSTASVVFDRRDPATGSVHLRVGDPLGFVSRRLTDPGPGAADTHPIRSPNGHDVTFMRESESGVAIGVIRIGHPSSLRWVDTGCAAIPDCAADINPTWYRDGSRILFTRVMGPFDGQGDAASADLYTTRLNGNDLRRVGAGAGPGSEDTGAVYVPGGQRLVFIRDRRIDGILRFAIFRMRADGSHEQQLTPWELDADRPMPSPAHTGPTAGMMTFETFGGAEPGRGDIAMLPYMCESLEACTAAIRYVTHNGGGPRSSFAATWSPDGRFLAYAEEPDRSGRVDVWTSHWTGQLRHRMTTTGTSYSPSWS